MFLKQFGPNMRKDGYLPGVILNIFGTAYFGNWSNKGMFIRYWELALFNTTTDNVMNDWG